MRHILSILLENESGVLSRVSGLFSARGYNIESLTVSVTEDSSISRMTIVTMGTDSIVEQIIKQLNKLIEVIKIVDLNNYSGIERELMLIKVKVDKLNISNTKQLVDIFRAKILDFSDSTMIIEITGDCIKMDSFTDVLPKKDILEVVRTGVCGIARGNFSLSIKQ